MNARPVVPLDIAPDASVVVLTGAGISAESGIATFRDSGGLWEQHRVEEVATHEGFVADPGLVWRFYSARREAALRSQPNAAHRAIAALERFLEPRGRFTLVTQNVDGLHERAGSRRVLRVHGSLFQTRCDDEECGASTAPVADESLHPDGPPRCKACGGLLRPHIVWFGEALDPMIELQARTAIADCDLFLAVGSSGVVWPVAGYARLAYEMGARTVLANLEAPQNVASFREVYLGKAGAVLPVLLANAMTEFEPGTGN